MTWQVILTVSATLVLFTNSQHTGDPMTLSLKARKLPYDICGESTVNQYTTLSDSNAPLGAYPWMAAIGYYIEGLEAEGPFWICGGSLVTDQFVVTAAHCLKGNEVSVVRLGDLDLDDAVNDGASPVDIEVESTKSNPAFDDKKIINDIGLVKLKTKVQFDTFKKPICLPSPEFYQKSFVDFAAVVIGWGNGVDGERSYLAEAAVVIKDKESCRRNLTSFGSPIVVDEKVICASSPGQDACKGDSGSPLMMFRRYEGKNKMFLAGVVSYGHKCAVYNFPGVYTRVSHFMDWIIDNLEL